MQSTPKVLANLTDFHENKDEIGVSLDGNTRLADRCCPLARSYLALKATAKLALEQEGIERAKAGGQRFPLTPEALPTPPKQIGRFAKFLGFKPTPLPAPATNLFPEVAEAAAVAKSTGVPTSAAMTRVVVTDEGLEVTFDSGHILKTDHRHDIALRTVRLLQEFDALHVENVPAMLAINQALGRPMMRYEKVAVKQVERLHDDLKADSIEADAQQEPPPPLPQNHDVEQATQLPEEGPVTKADSVSESDPAGIDALDPVGSEFGPTPVTPAPVPPPKPKPSSAIPRKIPIDDVLAAEVFVSSEENPFNEGADASASTESSAAEGSAGADPAVVPHEGAAVPHAEPSVHEGQPGAEGVEPEAMRPWNQYPVRITQKAKPSANGPFILTAKSDELVDGKPKVLGDFEVEKQDYAVIQWLHQNKRDARFKIELTPQPHDPEKEQEVPVPKAKIVGVKLPNHSSIMVNVDWAHCRTEFEAADKKVQAPEVREKEKSAVIETEIATPLLPGTTQASAPKAEEVEPAILPLPGLRPIAVPKSVVLGPEPSM